LFIITSKFFRGLTLKIHIMVSPTGFGRCGVTLHNVDFSPIFFLVNWRTKIWKGISLFGEKGFLARFIEQKVCHVLIGCSTGFYQPVFTETAIFMICRIFKYLDNITEILIDGHFTA